MGVWEYWDKGGQAEINTLLHDSHTPILPYSHTPMLHNAPTPLVYSSASVTNAIFVMSASWRIRMISTTSP